MRLGEKSPAAVTGNGGASSTTMSELQNIPEVRIIHEFAGGRFADTS